MKTALFLWIFIMISFCGISKPIDSLIVEYGGGMTVRITKYKIIENSVYKSSGTLVRLESTQANTTAKRLKKIYKTAQKLMVGQEGFDHPGNMYKKIILYSKGKKVQYNWGEFSFEPPSEVKELYDQIIFLTKELKFQ